MTTKHVTASKGFGYVRFQTFAQIEDSGEYSFCALESELHHPRQFWIDIVGRDIKIGEKPNAS